MILFRVGWGLIVVHGIPNVRKQTGRCLRLIRLHSKLPGKLLALAYEDNIDIYTFLSPIHYAMWFRGLFVQNFQVKALCQSLPSIICHGSEDQVVRLQWAEMSKKKLQDEGVRAIDWHIYPGMEHSACMEEIDTVTAWLKRILPCKATAETK